MRTLVKAPSDTLIPVYKHKGDAGADLISPVSVTIKPRQRVIIDTLIAVKIPKHTFLAIVSRSGLAAKNGIAVLNSPGVIDESFSDTIKVILQNHSNKSYKVTIGDRIAQAILLPYKKMKFKKVNQLGSPGRGKNGLGSTGK